MKIVKLKAENFKRIKAVEIIPNDDVITITGRNDQGKSSILDAIFAALGGADASPRAPIRQGENRATAEVFIDDLIIRRVWTENGNYLTVETGGMEVKKPQSILDALYGKLTFDPLEFERMKQDDRVNMLLSVLKLEKDPRIIDSEIKMLYEDRRDVNRDLKRELLALETANFPGIEGVPDEPPDFGELNERFSEAANMKDDILKYTVEIQSMERERENLIERAQDIDRKIVDLITERDRLSANAEDLTSAISGKSAELEDIKNSMPDMQEIREEMEQAQKTTDLVSKKKQYNAIFQKVESLKAAADSMTEKMERLREEKTQILANADMPVDGLGFDEDGVTYNGIPFDQISTSKRVLISTSIAMAVNPKLKVLLARNGNDLDRDSMKALREMVKENGYQLWIEVVDSDEKTGIIIEDGEVRPPDVVKGESA